MARFSLFALGVSVLALPPAAFGGTCALCRQALASGGNPGLIQGFYWSIILIAGMPLIMMGVTGILAWRHQRRYLHHKAAGGPSDA